MSSGDIHTPSEGDDPRVSGRIEFHFEKSAYFRVIHVDGAVGSSSPNSTSIHMSVYSERVPLPKKVVHEITKGVLGAELMEERAVRSGVYREVEADLVMSFDTAVLIRDWLTSQLLLVQQVGERIKNMEEDVKP